ncbi:MAG: hypothetical protein ABI054_01375 [Planctomycetota bacterium]
MSPNLPSPGTPRLQQGKEARRAEVLAAAKAQRVHNRELLLKRERDAEPPQGPLRTFLTVVLCGLFFLPLIGFDALIALTVNRKLGSAVAWIVFGLGLALISSVVYNGPRLLRAMTSDVSGLVKSRKREPQAFWGALALLLAIATLLYAALFTRR